MTKLLLHQNLPTHWLSTIIDRNKIIIARTRNLDKYLGKSSTPLFAEMSAKAREASWQGIPHEGEPVLAGSNRSELTGWTVGVAAPISTLDAPVMRILALVATGGFFLLMGGSLAFILSLKITTSINRLGNAARKLEAGDLSARVGRREDPREIGELSRLFDQMGASLQFRENQLAITHRLSQRILGGENLDTLAKETLKSLLSTLSLDFGSVRIANFDRRSLRVLATIGFRNASRISTHPPLVNISDETGGFRIINTGKSYVVGDIPKAPGLRTLKGEGGKSAILVPVVDQNQKTLGILHAVSRSPRKFSDNEIKFVENIGAHLGIAIERKQAEEDRQQLLIAQSHAMPGISRLDIQGRYVSVNQAYAGMLGYDPQELLGTDWQRSVHPEDQPVALAAYERMTCEGQSELEARAVRKDGTLFYVQALLVKIIDYNGDFIGYRRFIRDISERKHAEELLRNSKEQFRALTARTESVLEEARTRISRDIHDALGQLLTALKFDLHWVKAKLPAGGGGSLSDKLTSMSSLLDEATGTVRKIATKLRPPLLENLGLAAAMEWQMQDIQSRTGIRCYFQYTPTESQLDPKVSTALFRSFQEILTNAVQHSGATAVGVEVKSHNGTVIIQVADNGLGMPPEAISSKDSLGLLGVRERVQLVGGEVNIESAHGKGTTVTIKAPISRT